MEEGKSATEGTEYTEKKRRLFQKNARPLSVTSPFIVAGRYFG
jgi:hypothetical protein